MAFTVKVIDREDLEVVAGRSCDTPNCGSSVGIGVAKDQADDAVTVQLSPLED